MRVRKRESECEKEKERVSVRESEMLKKYEILFRSVSDFLSKRPKFKPTGNR